MKKKNKTISKTANENNSLKEFLEKMQVQNEALNKILENVNQDKMKSKDNL
jgi:hypothetical protein